LQVYRPNPTASHFFEEAPVIKGVVIKKLLTHIDDRGFFREIIRVTDEFFVEGFAQWSYSLMFDG